MHNTLLLNTVPRLGHFNFAPSGFLTGPNHRNIKSLFCFYFFSRKIKCDHGGDIQTPPTESSRGALATALLVTPMESSQMRETVAAWVPTIVFQSADE